MNKNSEKIDGRSKNGGHINGGRKQKTDAQKKITRAITLSPENDAWVNEKKCNRSAFINDVIDEIRLKQSN